MESKSLSSFAKCNWAQALINIYTEEGLFPGFLGGAGGEESACHCETGVWSLHQEDPLEEGLATHSSILAWRIPGTEEPHEQATAHRVTKADMTEAT